MFLHCHNLAATLISVCSSTSSYCSLNFQNKTGTQFPHIHNLDWTSGRREQYCLQSLQTSTAHIHTEYFSNINSIPHKHTFIGLCISVSVQQNPCKSKSEKDRVLNGYKWEQLLCMLLKWNKIKIFFHSKSQIEYTLCRFGNVNRIRQSRQLSRKLKLQLRD